MAERPTTRLRRNATAKNLTIKTNTTEDDAVKALSPLIPSIAYHPASSTSSVGTYNSTFSATEDAASTWPPLADDSLADSDDEGTPGATSHRGQHLYHHYLNHAAHNVLDANKTPPASPSSKRTSKKAKKTYNYNSMPCSPSTPLHPPIRRPSLGSDDDAIPSALPPYRARHAAPPVRPSDPQIFRNLFPSMDRLSVRHDDRSVDGNMSLRIDAMAAGSVTGFGYGSRKKYSAVQLFHLRMHDLAKREFSLRRYGRDSGREVCSAKREYAEPSAVSTALRSVKAPFRRSNLHAPGASSSARKHSVGGAACSASSTPAASRNSVSPQLSSPLSPTFASSLNAAAAAAGSAPPCFAVQQPAKPIVPTDTIKLEFSNYARVEVRRCGSKRYEFEWWGHSYAWRRDVDKTLGGVSFHLIRDGHGAPVAHVVPEMRSPNQVDAEEEAGGWIPPCYMWISDKSIIDAATDVADIVIATGLIALVDDSIKERWQLKKQTHAARRSSLTHAATPRTSFMRDLFRRSRTENQNQNQHQQARPVSHHEHQRRRGSAGSPVFKTPVY